MRNIVWITAPAGAGKTEVLHRLRSHFPASDVISDAQETLVLNRSDTRHEHHTHPHGDDRFLLTSTKHFDGAVKRVVTKLQNTPPDRLVFVELSRGKGNLKHIDTSYAHFLELVPVSIFDRSLFIYIEADSKKRMDRNDRRPATDFAALAKEVSFQVPPAAMKGFYAYDDFAEVRSRFPCPVFVIRNGDISLAGLDREVAAVAARIDQSIA
jgi:hypothetical protein